LEVQNNFSFGEKSQSQTFIFFHSVTLIDRSIGNKNIKTSAPPAPTTLVCNVSDLVSLLPQRGRTCDKI